MWGRRAVAKRAMRPFGVVEAPPLLDEDLCLLQRIEDFHVQALVSELAVEAFAVAVFPWRARLDIERLDVQPIEPAPHGLRDKFSAVIRSDVIGHAMLDKEIRQASPDIVAAP